MFEEVPRVRRGLAGLPVRRFALGPFVIGGGMALVAVGGSVAVAATMITASTIASTRVINDVPARRPPASTVLHPGAGSSQAPASSVGSARRASSAAIAPNGPLNGLGTTRPPGPSWAAPVRTGPADAQATVTAPQATPTASSSGPVGNALIHVIGYDRASGTLVFEYASLYRGAGAGGSDLYQVSDPSRFSAGLAAGLTIISGGRLCPPAGSTCSVAELIAGAADGFFAEAAINPTAQLESIVEVDNADADAQAAPSASRADSGFAPTGTPQPSASPTGSGGAD
jgi:hypothetical protein